MAYDMEVGESVKSGSFMPTRFVDSVNVDKPENQWTRLKNKIVQCDWKAYNIIISTLGVDGYYDVSHCQITKAMWDTLQETYDGTNELKQAWMNILTQEYKLFHMRQGKPLSTWKRGS